MKKLGDGMSENDKIKFFENPNPLNLQKSGLVVGNSLNETMH